MKLGDVFNKERERKGLSVAETAQHLKLTEEEYRDVEAGETEVETWGPRLAQIAIKLETPTSRLLAESGRFDDTRPGQTGELIRRHRERQGLSTAALAEQLDLPESEYTAIEAGESPLERFGPLCLGFAELVEQPVFNLFYPTGLPFQELEDYP